MQQKSRQSVSFYTGFGVSFALHVFCALITIVLLENSAARASKPQEVFSVTLEGGMNLGGHSQVPKENAKKILTPSPNDEPDAKESTEETTQSKEQKEVKLTVPSVVDDPAKLLEQQKKEEAKKEKEKKLQEEKIEKQKEKEQKAKEDAAKEKQKEIDDKKKAAEQKKKEEEDKKKERLLRDKQLSDTLKKLKNQYEGESADAGGKGFGAAALGGKGMGGGTLSSLERIAYSNSLQRHVKEGWRWLNSSERLKARVEVSILPDGRIQNVNIIQKSGNSNFDDSVVRAVFKASPVPAAPADLYNDFKDVVFTFDSAE